VFNYSTGPVELAANVRAALQSAPETSHSPLGQIVIADTYRLLRKVLDVPRHFDVVLLPGSVRQALVSVIRVAAPANGSCVSAVSGYWGRFMADACRAVAPQAVEAQSCDFERMDGITVGGAAVRLVTVTEMETETGLMPDEVTRDWIAHARASGALVITDAACTAPVHPIDYEAADVIVLGSHKCLSAPAGLAILLIRNTVNLRPDWAIDAFRRDARHKDEFVDGLQASPSHAPPLPTLPIELVSALGVSLRNIGAEASPLWRAASAAAQLREGCRALGLALPFAGPLAGATVTRIDIPSDLGAEAVRTRLAERGYFVIGSIGDSGGGFIRVGTMSPAQCEPANVSSFLEALAVACRAD
jgi:aspartate aminotransferase-like enzyme